MNKVIRYAVKMKNGDYMRQDLDDTQIGRILIRTVDHPIDSTLLKNKKDAERCIYELFAKSSNLPCVYDDDNPPETVQELKITVTIN